MTEETPTPFLIYGHDEPTGRRITPMEYEQLRSGRSRLEVLIDMTTAPYSVSCWGAEGQDGPAVELGLTRRHAQILKVLMTQPGALITNREIRRETGSAAVDESLDRDIRAAKQCIGAHTNGPRAHWFLRRSVREEGSLSLTSHAFISTSGATWMIITTEAPPPPPPTFAIKQTIQYASSVTGHHMIAGGRLSHRGKESVGIEDAYLTVNGTTYREEFGSESELTMTGESEEVLLREQTLPARDVLTFQSLWRFEQEPKDHPGDVATEGTLRLELADGSEVTVKCPMTPTPKMGTKAMRPLPFGRPSKAAPSAEEE